MGSKNQVEFRIPKELYKNVVHYIQKTYGAFRRSTFRKFAIECLESISEADLDGRLIDKVSWNSSIRKSLVINEALREKLEKIMEIKRISWSVLVSTAFKICLERAEEEEDPWKKYEEFKRRAENHEVIGLWLKVVKRLKDSNEENIFVEKEKIMNKIASILRPQKPSRIVDYLSRFEELGLIKRASMFIRENRGKKDYYVIILHTIQEPPVINAYINKIIRTLELKEKIIRYFECGEYAEDLDLFIETLLMIEKFYKKLSTNVEDAVRAYIKYKFCIICAILKIYKMLMNEDLKVSIEKFNELFKIVENEDHVVKNMMLSIMREYGIDHLIY